MSARSFMCFISSRAVAWTDSLLMMHVTSTCHSGFKAWRHLTPTPVSVHASVCPCIHPYICPSVHPSIRPSIHLSVRPSIYPSVDPSVGLTICLFNSLSTCQSIYLPIHPSNCSSERPTVIERSLLLRPRETRHDGRTAAGGQVC